MYTDVVGQLAVGGNILGLKNRSYNTMHRALSNDVMFYLDSQTGEIRGNEINAKTAINTPQIYISDGKVKWNGTDGFFSIGNGNIALNPNGQIDASAAINSGYAMTAPTINATTKLNALAIDTTGSIACGENLSVTGWIGAAGEISSSSSFVLKSNSGRFDGQDANGTNVFSLITKPANSVGNTDLIWTKGNIACDGHVNAAGNVYCN